MEQGSSGQDAATRPALDEEFFTSILEDNRASVRATVRDALLEGITRQFQWEVPDTVKKVVNAFITEEIVPEIRAELEKNKDAFVAVATEMARSAATEVAKAMQARIAENLANSYNLKRVVEAML